MNEDQLWDQVANELKRGELDDGLWLKTRTLVNGTKEESERAYVLARFEQLKEKALHEEAELDRQNNLVNQPMREKGKKVLGTAWERLLIAKRNYPGTRYIKIQQLRGDKSALTKPRRIDFVAGQAGLDETFVIDAIMSGSVRGIFDGTWWWVEIG